MENLPANPSSLFPPNSALAVMQGHMSRQPIFKQMVFLLAIAASIAIGGFVLMWSQQPSYQLLYTGMQPAESNAVVEALQQMQIKYRLDPNTGGVLVPSKEVQGLRMRLAAEGLPRSAAPGMDMLNQDQGFGTSQFIERARYQRAMEQELSRSIAELQNVRSARVHLAIPKQSVFVRDRQSPSASVVVNLFSGRSLEKGQVAAITHLVASSVSDLQTRDVTVVDQRGNLLTQPERDSSVAMSDSQLEYTQRVEALYIRRIEDILTPIAGFGGVRAQVVAEVDFTLTEQTQELYNPEAAVRSEQLAEEERTGMSGPMGVPGALSNQPPGGGVAPEVAVNEAVEGAELTASLMPGSRSQRTTRNFELDRTISHTRMAPGSVKRLNVAVLIDEARTLDAEGNVVSQSLSEEEMARINALVREAIGFSEARGDSLNIVNAPFRGEMELEPLPSVAFWETVWFWDIAKQVLGALLVLLLIFGVIRPAFRDMTKLPEGAVAAADGGSEAAPLALAGTGGQVPEIAKLTTGAETVEQQLVNVRSLVQQDPALVAQVVKNWTASDA